MRMAGAVALLVIVFEVVIGLGFLAGFFWVGGLRGGLLVSGVLLLLIVTPWLGELRVWFDSRGPAATVKLSWWGRLTFRTLAQATELRARLLMVPWRRRMERKPKQEPAPTTARTAEATAEGVPEKEPIEKTSERRPGRPRTQILQAIGRMDSTTAEGFSRLLAGALQAVNDLTWGAAEITVRIDDPTQEHIVDQALERVIARRELRPLDLMVVASGGDRRVRLRYRIGMLRAALAALQLIVDGRLLAFTRTMKEKKRAAREVELGDSEVIGKIIEEREDGADV